MEKQKNTEGLLIIISSPSGGGKTTVRDRLFELIPDLYYSVSCTTRKPRQGEIHGRDYYFIALDEFLEKKEKGEFLEHAEVFGSFYGTPKKDIDDTLKKGRDVLLDIDTQGAMQIKSKREAVLIFILPPSLEILKGRLYNRKTDSESEIWKRFKDAERELKFVLQYDYAVINDNIEMTVEKIKSIILAERYRVGRQMPVINVFLDSMSSK
jgi:guanylate kinase